MGSSKYLRKDIKEFGRENFNKIPLFIFDNRMDMVKKEAELVNREFCHRIDTYNRFVGGCTDFCWTGTITVKNPEGGNMKVYNDDPRWLSGELKSCLEGIKRSNETKEKVRQANLGKKQSGETIEKRISSLKEVDHTEEWNNKIRDSKSKNLYQHSEEVKKKMKGRIVSEQTKEKLRNNHKHLTISNENRKAINEAIQRKISCSNGITYDSVKHASDELKIYGGSIIKVCKNKRKSAGGYKFNYVDII